ARKITHYGSYSYLAFNRGQNQAKGVWPTLASPLIQRFSPGETELSTGSRNDLPSVLLARDKGPSRPLNR
ncbi:MAG: hypothetical protein PVJ00_08590, partial [Desulfobacterales bacterium]